MMQDAPAASWKLFAGVKWWAPAGVQALLSRSNPGPFRVATGNDHDEERDVTGPT